MPSLAPLQPHRPARVIGPKHAARSHASPSWRRVIAAGVVLLAIVGLLGIFLQVVREAVRQGELRREATARHSAATWRCIASRSIGQRDICLAQLNARPPEVTLLPAAAEQPDPLRQAQSPSH